MTEAAIADPSPTPGRVSVQTTDVGEFVDLVNRLFGHHRIVSLAGSKLDGIVHAQRCNALIVGQLEYGADASLEVDEARTGWVITQARDAEGAWDSNGFQPGELMMFPPEWCGTLDVLRPTKFRNTFVPIPDMHEALASMLGSTPDQPLSYAPRMAPGVELTERLSRIIDLMYTASHGASAIAPVMQQAWQRTFAMELLCVWPHSYSRYLERPTLLPRALHRACDYIEAHLREPISVVDVARAASVGVRALELGFARHFDESPLRYIRNRRLDAAKADLQASRGRVGILNLALKWGFSNAGQFAKCYRERFGELPSRALMKLPPR
ncbi:MAG: AraC family transcriptional regulator [Burkholderiales bacterium]|nr:AraC family transcriptional regulator [Burkholderiales bacterium]